ncbi:hypothetical protein [Teichococcus oryzae]|uniref:Uncharacterized protein n=1 Tax=Teichococcus oryzae TaxID=1608942 RepID=A0A5B2TEF1_9PROT|nr:hypothetical protein [Pseudoroseomonas oryzae]KAA2212180.1 hypothetical protein F0Q34_16175 [Pseudoroseomonas oryzae]
MLDEQVVMGRREVIAERAENPGSHPCLALMAFLDQASDHGCLAGDKAFTDSDALLGLFKGRSRNPAECHRL